MHSRFLKHVRRRWRGLFSGAAIVLLYHRVSEGGADPWGLCVSPDNFNDHLALLRYRGFSLVSMRSLVQALATTGVPDRSVVITFDDGYADNLYEALPALTRHEAPATVFVSGSQVDAEREFWWDTLTRILLETDDLPDRLDPGVLSSDTDWQFSAASGERRYDLREFSTWKVSDAAPTVRHLAYRTIWKKLFAMRPAEREAAIDRIARWAGTSTSVTAPSCRPVTRTELQTLASSSLIEIGAHTWTHPSLSVLPPLEQAAELNASKQWLQQVVSSPVVGCSYPHGRYTPVTLQLARDAGYTYAACSRADLVFDGADPLALPRVTVENWAGSKFDGFLTSHFGA